MGAESGLYIYNLTNDKITHLTVPDQDDSYALSDNAIYSLCCDKENGMWIGSYFCGVNFCPYQWTYFEKFYPRDNLRHFGRRVREICESNDGTLWIGTGERTYPQIIPVQAKAVDILINGRMLKRLYLSVFRIVIEQAFVFGPGR